MIITTNGTIETETGHITDKSYMHFRYASLLYMYLYIL